MKTLELTEEELNILHTYLLLSTNFREKEQKTCEELGEILNEDGTVKYPNIKSNGIFWNEMNNCIENIIAKI